MRPTQMQIKNLRESHARQLAKLSAEKASKEKVFAARAGMARQLRALRLIDKTIVKSQRSRS